MTMAMMSEDSDIIVDVFDDVVSSGVTGEGCNIETEGLSSVGSGNVREGSDVVGSGDVLLVITSVVGVDPWWYGDDSIWWTGCSITKTGDLGKVHPIRVWGEEELQSE